MLAPRPANYTEWQSYFTGSLLAPTGTVLPVGHYDIEPYLFYTVTNGAYDQHWRAHKTPNFYSATAQLYANAGLTEWMDFEVYIPVAFNHTSGQSDFGLADVATFLGFQLYPDNAYLWRPGVQLTINELLPLGKYNRLNPDKQKTDWFGNGSWGTGLSLIFYKLVHIEKEKFLSLNVNFTYTLFSKVKVEGFNAYGGGFGTEGTVKPGNNFGAGFSFEYSFTRYWAIAVDTIYQHLDKDRFSRKESCTKGTLSKVGYPSSEQISLSPAIEYNFNTHLGIIGGIWFTIMGRNSNRFQSAVIAVNYVY